MGVGVPNVLVGQIFQRGPWAVKSTSYNEDVVAIDLTIKEWLSLTEGAYFWHHRGFWDSFDSLAHDGVYIHNSPHDPRYMKKYLQSVKSAMLFASRINEFTFKWSDQSLASKI